MSEELFQKVCTVIDDVNLFRSILQLFTVLDMEYFYDENTWRIIARNIYMLGCGSSTETVPVSEQCEPEKETEHVQAHVPNPDGGLETVLPENRKIFPDTPEWENPTTMVVYETVPKQQCEPEKETEHVQAHVPNPDGGLEAVFAEHREIFPEDRKIFPDTPEWENPTTMVVYEDWEDVPYQ